MRQPGYIFLLLLFAPACGRGVQLNLILNDPCNQSVLGDVAFPIRHIELEARAPDLAAPEGTIWSRADGEGEMLELTPVEQATVSVIGRGANASGDPGDPLAATSVGRIDLSGADGSDVVDLDVMIGKVDTFVNTTDTPAASDGAAQCTQLVAKRRGHTASLLPNGRVFIAGGERVNTDSVTYWSRQNVAASTVRCSSLSLAEARGAAALVSLPGGFLIAGGVGASSQVLASAERIRFDDVSDCDAAIESTAGALGMPRGGSVGAALVGGDVLITGGFAMQGGDVVSLAHGEIYVRQR